MLVSPSMLAPDFSHLADELEKITDDGANFACLGIMNGVFIPNISSNASMIATMRSHMIFPFDVHLTIQRPKEYIVGFAKAGVDIASFHTECADDLEEVIEETLSHGAKPAMVVKPNTPAESIFPYLNELYLALVTTVEPDFDKQSSMSGPLLKVRQIKEKDPSVLIEVNGGTNAQTILECAQAGADARVAGTGIFKAGDPTAVIRQLQSAGR